MDQVSPCAGSGVVRGDGAGKDGDDGHSGNYVEWEHGQYRERRNSNNTDGDVKAGATAVSPGLVNFCDANATYCEDVHIIGSAQLTSSGSAVFKFRPGIGSHSYKAAFVGTNTSQASTSSTAQLSVTGTYPTATTYTQTGGLGSYNVTATVTGTGLLSPAPTGTVSFLDASNGNAVLGNATLGTGTSLHTLLNSNVTPVGTNPLNDAVGDFNGDGIPDLIVSNRQDATAQVLLGSSVGSFVAGVTLTTGFFPEGIAVGDFNSDGNLDLAIVNNNNYGLTPPNSTVSIFIGKGDGTFTSAPLLTAGLDATVIVISDFNNDGIPDLAVANYFSYSISVFIGTGDGTLSTSTLNFGGMSMPLGIVAADFNGDGKQDLIWTGIDPFLHLLLGNGDGTFTTGPTTSAPAYSAYLALADFNQDGIPDIAVSNDQQPMIVMLGTGTGSFVAASNPGWSLKLTTGDFNGDGIPDIATVEGGFGTLLQGDGTGQFTTTATVSQSTNNLLCLSAADFNGDGLSDLAAGAFASPGQNPGFVELLLSSSRSSASATTSLTIPSGSHLAKASYPGDSVYGASISDTTALNGPAATTLALSASAGPYTYGQSISLTANLSPYTSSGYSTTGEPVDFHFGSTLLGTGFLSNGTAFLSVSSLPAGSDTLHATYAGDGKFVASTSSDLTLSIAKATPTITWATPSAITYGGALGSGQLNATASVPGTFSYSPAEGTVPSAGSQSLTVTFTPTDTANYNSATASVTLVVNQYQPVIAWVAPAAITYGTPLGSAQLNATTSVPGTFSYSPAAGTILQAGYRPITVTFTPTDTTDYKTASATVYLSVLTAMPTITWPTPAPITYGTALSASQLNATASVPGTFSYAYGIGYVPRGGNFTLYAYFYPTDSQDFSFVSTSVTLVVNQATPTITWNTPAPIKYGTPLTITQLNATASTSGSYTYSPGSGTILGVGSQQIAVNFHPYDTQDYTTATASVTLQVNQGTPSITWPKPATITYGTPLGSAQLNATSPVAGTISYSPTAGTVLGAGTQSLSATLTPTDTTNYTTATSTNTLVVNPATPPIT